ncbi:MAG: hypothetical protein K940chlam3_01605 [Chlamydiae bacterium]|nr:hypothetical protein [Chlamydiota bacterium]
MKRIRDKFKNYFSYGNWIYLFHALIILLIIFPYIQESDYPQAPLILAFLNGLVVLAIIYEVSFTRLQFILALVLGIPIFVLYWFPYSPTAHFAQIVLHTILYLYAIIMILTVLIPRLTADIETIFGTISLYILLGLYWANIYQMIAFFRPDAFAFSNPAIEKVLDWSDFLYYSFVTLTTLGYGDIIPIAPQARSVAMLEAMTGVMFIAVIVSKTIALYVGEIRSRTAK